MSTPSAPITHLLSLIAQLPLGLRADWDGTNHYELTTSDPNFPWWWLILEGEHDCQTETGRRVGLLLDLAEAAKTAEPHLHREL